ncbi:MAG: hypothetical protein VCC04_14390, partial [Myxococcota bacterium]
MTRLSSTQSGPRFGPRESAVGAQGCRPAGLRGVLVLLVILAAPTWAEEPQLPALPFVLAAVPSPDGPVFEVADFAVQYTHPSPDLPPIQDLLPLSVSLAVGPGGYKEARSGEPTQIVRIETSGTKTAYHASALAAISRVLLKRLHEKDLMGVYVRPSPKDIDIQQEKDLRPPGDYGLRFDVWVGRVKDVRTIALGDRIGKEWRVDNPIHRDIRSYSPMQPIVSGRESSSDVLDRSALEDYVFYLNRHPGRNVEVALAASDDREGITVDYRVYEEKPWSVY